MICYSLRSKKLKRFLRPNFFQSYEDAYKSSEWLFKGARFDDSFELYQLGYFNPKTGKFKRKLIKLHVFNDVYKFYDDLHQEEQKTPQEEK